MKYIIVEYGCPCVADELPSYEPNRLAVLGRNWEHVHAFSEESRFSLLVDPGPQSTILQRILAHTIYNPIVSVSVEWQPVGKSKMSDILALVEDGLEHDDDIIQQWFDASEVMSLLMAAETWENLIMAVKCICGEHETNAAAAKFVDAVLPNRIIE